MSSILNPSLRTYPVGDLKGCVAEFPTVPTEYLKAERFVGSLGINWTTTLSPVEIPIAIDGTLPGVASVEVWHDDGIEKLSSTDSEGIQQAISRRETTRLTYTIEPGEVSEHGLMFAWRIRTYHAKRPHQFGVRLAENDLTIVDDLIRSTATDAVRNSTGLLGKTLEEI